MQEFLQHIKIGLSQKPKALSSVYFYDQEGDKIFQQIMKMPSYYLPAAEMNIIQNQSEKIAQQIANQHENIQIVEFGAGDGSKTKFLLRHFQNHFQNLDFVALDISDSVLNTNQSEILKENLKLNYNKIAGDYFETYKRVELKQNTGRLILLLGGNIGNYTLEQSQLLLKFIYENSKPGDFILISFDLVKDPRRIIETYDDKDGITKAFNLNLLKRINHTFGADFNIEKFDHFPYYNPVTGIAHSHLISLEKQKVNIPGAGIFEFDAFESIHTEISKKYWPAEITEIAEKSNLQFIENFFDQHRDYALALMQI